MIESTYTIAVPVTYLVTVTAPTEAAARALAEDTVLGEHPDISQDAIGVSYTVA